MATDPNTTIAGEFSIHAESLLGLVKLCDKTTGVKVEVWTMTLPFLRRHQSALVSRSKKKFPAHSSV
jgi:hypothetical protein